MRRITKAKFAEWLNRFDDGVVVGYTHACSSCPVALFYQEYFGMDWVDVGASYMLYLHGGNVYKQTLPLWANNFIRGVDSLSERFDMPVTAGKAREIFANV